MKYEMGNLITRWMWFYPSIEPTIMFRNGGERMVIRQYLSSAEEHDTSGKLKRNFRSAAIKIVCRCGIIRWSKYD